MDKDIKKKLTRNWFINLQEMICNTIQKIEGGNIKFLKKSWKRSIKKDEGGGCYYILENGKVFDKVGVNFSEVYGKLTKEFKKKIPGTKNNRDFWASGVSVVMHMKNPHVPAMHFNTRYIYTNHGWFGGGMDVTPCFNDPTIRITATVVRIPVIGGHCESVNIETLKSFNLDEVIDVLNNSAGVIVQDNPKKFDYPMPITSQYKNDVFVGRIRIDETIKNGLNLWIVADNLRKGAATNAVQILDYILQNKLL